MLIPKEITGPAASQFHDLGGCSEVQGDILWDFPNVFHFGTEMFMVGKSQGGFGHKLLQSFKYIQGIVTVLFQEM